MFGIFPEVKPFENALGWTLGRTTADVAITDASKPGALPDNEDVKPASVTGLRAESRRPAS